MTLVAGADLMAWRSRLRERSTGDDRSRLWRSRAARPLWGLGAGRTGATTMGPAGAGDRGSRSTRKPRRSTARTPVVNRTGAGTGGPSGSAWAVSWPDRTTTAASTAAAHTSNHVNRDDGRPK